MAEKVTNNSVADSQNVVLVGGDVSAGGDVNISIGGRIQMIQRRTTKRIQVWTKGMVVTAGLTQLMEKLHSGITWVTVKGQPGEGKTTAAYMALKALQESGRQVFQVLSPEEFTEVATTFPHSVILLDDLFGQVVFDPAAWSRWKQVILDMLGERTHTSHGKTSKENLTVIFVGRNYVLNNVSNDIAKYFTGDNHVVFMSKTGGRKNEEKVAILKAICESKAFELDDETIDRMCHVNGPHGFPHTCQLFVTLRLEGVEIDTVKFMEAPLKFLNQTVQKFLEDSTKLLLFKEMIKSDGKITDRELLSLDNDVSKLANTLLDSYLRKEDDCYSFHHPSIYDSVAFNLLEYDPLFVIKHCSVSFLHERLRLKPRETQQATPNSESNLVVQIARNHLRDLAKRFAKEMLNRNLVHVLSHPAVTDEQFVQEMMSHIWFPRIRLPRFIDRNTGNSFLSLIASSKSPQILKYLENKIPGKFSDSKIKTFLYEMCQNGAPDVLTYLEQSRDTLDINVRNQLNKTPLMIASEFNQVEMVKLLLTRGASWDEETLIEACRSGSVDVVKFLFTRGATVDMTADRASPLTAAIESNQVEMVKLLLTRGASWDEYTLIEACKSGSLDVVKFLFEREATVNMTTDRGTLLTAASEGGHVDVMRFLIYKGASVNTADRNGISPLWRACYCNKPQTAQWLLDHGADSNSGNRWAEAPLHEAAHSGSKDCVVVLVNAGADVNVQNTRGWTPHYIAAHSGSKDCAVVLVNAGADVNVQNMRGDTPLHRATYSGSKDCVVVLVNAGADVNVQNRWGETPLHIAKQNQHKQIIDLLQKAGAVIG